VRFSLVIDEKRYGDVQNSSFPKLWQFNYLYRETSKRKLSIGVSELKNWIIFESFSDLIT